jgi:cytochrome b561
MRHSGKTWARSCPEPPSLGVVGLLASQRMLVRAGDAITISTRMVLRQNKAAALLVFLAVNLRSNEDLEQIAMIKTFESAEGLAVKAAARSARFDPTSIVLHWLTVLLVIGQFTTAWLHEAVGHGTILALEILATHQTMGVLTWTVGLARLVWRRRFAYLPPFPESAPKLQQWIAKTNEYGLYVLLLVQPITGLGDVVFHGHPFTLFIWHVPALLAPDASIRSLFQEAHELGAKALLALIGLHAGAALFHGLVLRDGVLQRMLPLSIRIGFLPARANAGRRILVGTLWKKITS